MPPTSSRSSSTVEPATSLWGALSSSAKWGANQAAEHPIKAVGIALLTVPAAVFARGSCAKAYDFHWRQAKKGGWAREQFKLLDSNGDGDLTMEELERGLHNLLGRSAQKSDREMVMLAVQQGCSNKGEGGGGVGGQQNDSLADG